MAIYKNKCKNCGKEFLGVHTRKTCSDVCRQAMSRRTKQIRSTYLNAIGAVSQLRETAQDHPEVKKQIVAMLNDLHVQIGVACSDLFSAGEPKCNAVAVTLHRDTPVVTE